MKDSNKNPDLCPFFGAPLFVAAYIRYPKGSHWEKAGNFHASSDRYISFNSIRDCVDCFRQLSWDYKGFIFDGDTMTCYLSCDAVIGEAQKRLVGSCLTTPEALARVVFVRGFPDEIKANL